MIHLVEFQSLLSWIIHLSLLYLLLKYLLLPIIIQQVIEIIPVDKEPKFHYLNLTSINETGLNVSLIASVPYTKLPIPLLWIKTKVKHVSVSNYETLDRLLTIFILNDIYLDSTSDLVLKLNLRLAVEDTHGLQKLIKILLYGTQKDLDRITFRLNFPLSLSIMGFMNVNDVSCGKTVNLGQVRQWKDEFQKLIRQNKAEELKRRQEANQNLLNLPVKTVTKEARPLFVLEQQQGLIPELPNVIVDLPSHFSDLIPKLETTPFIKPGVMGVNAGLQIQFSKPPGLNIKLGKTTFDTIFNQNCIGKVVVEPLELSQLSKQATLKINFVPVTVAEPLSGPLKTVRSVLKGALNGTLNGILYGEWGRESTLIGFTNLKIENEDGVHVKWLLDLLNGLEYDYDVDAVRQIGNNVIEKTSDLKTAVTQVTAGIIQEAECCIM